MANDALVQAFVDAHEDDVIDLAALRVQCLSVITAGGGEVDFITNATSGGKTGSRQCKMDATELLSVVSQALRIINGKSASVTYADFSELR